MHVPSAEQQFIDTLTHAGFDVDFANEIIAEMAMHPVWEERDTILGTIIREMYDGNWFSIEGLAGIVEIRAGALAGSPLGDGLFTLVAKRVLSFLMVDLGQYLFTEIHRWG